MSNSELVVTGPKKGELMLDENCIKFDAKINTGDLIEAAVFETEEGLLSEKRVLEESNAILGQENREISDSLSKARTSFNKTFKDKESESLKSLLEKFAGIKFSMNYNTAFDNKKSSFKITATVGCPSDRYYNSSNQIEKVIEVKAPESYLKSYKLYLSNEVKINKNVHDINELDKQLKDLPRLKKRVKSHLVKNRVRSTKDGGQILKSLGDAIKEAQASA